VSRGTLGSYTIQNYLGSATDILEEGRLGPPSSYTIEVGINDIVNIRELLEHNPSSQVTDAIKIKISQEDNVEFYRVSIVSNFSHGQKLKYDYAVITVKLVSDFNEKGPIVYSVAPLQLNSSTKVTKRFAINPEIKLVEVVKGSIVSFTFEREYQKLHPYVIGHFEAGQAAYWEYKTTEAVDDIVGAQLLEFIVKQPSNVKSEWQISPEGELKWGSHGQRITSILFHKRIPNIEAKFRRFSIP